MEANPATQPTSQVKAPLVSVVVPTFNRAQLLSETVNSILGQTFQEFEIIIVDNMSEDGTEAYVKGLNDPRIRYYRNPNNGIIAINRNFGIRQARGTYVAFCDDDDLWLPEKLQKQLTHFSAEGISCVATDYIPIGDLNFINKSLQFLPGEKYRDFLYKEILFSFNPVVTSSTLVRKDFLLEEGGFDESREFQFIEDWELWLRLSRKNKIRILAEVSLKYRMCRKECRDGRQVALNLLKIMEKHYNLRYIDKKTFRSARGNCSVVIGKAFLDANDIHGIHYYFKGLLFSTGIGAKLRALGGLVLFCIPRALRNRLLNIFYLHLSKSRLKAIPYSERRA